MSACPVSPHISLEQNNSMLQALERELQRSLGPVVLKKQLDLGSWLRPLERDADACNPRHSQFELATWASLRRTAQSWTRARQLHRRSTEKLSVSCSRDCARSPSHRCQRSSSHAIRTILTLTGLTCAGCACSMPVVLRPRSLRVLALHGQTGTCTRVASFQRHARAAVSCRASHKDWGFDDETYYQATIHRGARAYLCAVRASDISRETTLTRSTARSWSDVTRTSGRAQTGGMSRARPAHLCRCAPRASRVLVQSRQCCVDAHASLRVAPHTLWCCPGEAEAAALEQEMRHIPKVRLDLTGRGMKQHVPAR